MAKITEVNYQEIPGKANSIQSEGRALNTELSTAWNSVNDLRSTWHGLKYNTLISYFNSITNEVNELLKMVIVQIPDALGTVAKNYALADGGSVPTVEIGSVTLITTLSDSDTTTMAYDSSTAAEVQSAVSNNFSNAKNNMDTIESIFNGINWNSEAKDAFQSKFSSLKSQIISALDNINTQYTNLMQAAKADIEGAESANTVE